VIKKTLLGVLCAGVFSLAACATSGNGGAAAPPSTAPPARASQATVAEPTSNVIVVCEISAWQPPTGEIAFYDASTGRPVGKPIVATSANQNMTSAGGGTFQPTGFAQIGQLFSCDQLSYDPTFHWIAGIDDYSTSASQGDAVPAMYNLVTGQVKDMVQPVSHNGFTPTPVTTYITAAFNYHNGDFWAVKQVDLNNVILVGPHGRQIHEAYSYDSATDYPPTLDFPGDGPPILANPASTFPDSNSPYLPSSILQDTNNQGMAVLGIRRPDNGDGSLGAFTEESQDNQLWGIFTVSLNGGVPTLLHSYQEPQTYTPQVIRYLP